jgi:hypothetical protein
MYALGATTIVGIVCIIVASTIAYQNVQDPLKRKKIIAGCIRSSMTNMFPLFLFTLLPNNDRMCEACIAPIVWVCLANVADSYLMFCAQSNDRRPASVRMDPQCITGLTFGLCAYLGTKSNDKYGHLFLYAILGCLTCVLPSHNLPMETVEAQIIESVQKSFMFGCIGLLIAGVTLTRRIHV